MTDAIPDGVLVVSALTDINLDYQGFLVNTIAEHVGGWKLRGEGGRSCWGGRC